MLANCLIKQTEYDIELVSTSRIMDGKISMYWKDGIFSTMPQGVKYKPAKKITMIRKCKHDSITGHVLQFFKMDWKMLVYQRDEVFSNKSCSKEFTKIVKKITR